MYEKNCIGCVGKLGHLSGFLRHYLLKSKQHFIRCSTPPHHDSSEVRKITLFPLMSLVFIISGAILVFLPGYDEIVSLRERIFDDKAFGDNVR